MQLEDFEVGKVYRMVEEDFVSPIDPSQVSPGRVKVRRILMPVGAHHFQPYGRRALPEELRAWAKFLRVQDPESGRVHLQAPECIRVAQLLS